MPLLSTKLKIYTTVTASLFKFFLSHTVKDKHSHKV
ncbi:hypothetical protein DSUL_20366 [Desulfovibrionales bacterium]